MENKRNHQTRDEKIALLKKAAAGQLNPDDLILLLPVSTEVWLQEGPDLYIGPSGELTSRQLDEYAGGGKRLHLVIIENPNLE
jgi:hypothetical protein